MEQKNTPLVERVTAPSGCFPPTRVKDSGSGCPLPGMSSRAASEERFCHSVPGFLLKTHSCGSPGVLKDALTVLLTQGGFGGESYSTEARLLPINYSTKARLLP